MKFAPLAVSANVTYAFDASPVGDRVSPADVKIDGAALNPTKTYRVAALAYTVIGADGYPAFKTYTNPVRNNTDHETFASYQRTHKILTPTPLTRVVQKG